MTGRRRIRLVLLLAFPLAVLAAFAAVMFGGEDGRTRQVRPARPIGLFTSLPILWREADDISGLLDDKAPPHWALAVFSVHGDVQPLDTLSVNGGALGLAADGLLVIAQPRPLAPQENVALDDWVRAGGKVLLFADPMLTAHSAFALGDNRRPQDIALLSPILSRWGLTLRFDDAQPFGERDADLFGNTVPVNLPGSFALADGAGSCVIQSGGLAAKCAVGRGQVIAVADAAMLEDAANGDAAQREAALGALLSLLGE